MPCPEHDWRAGMSDAEFWQYIFPNGRDWEPEPEDYPVLVAFKCLRCGAPVEVEDYAEMVDRQFDEFCDDCADELLPDVDAMWPEVTP